MDRTRWKYAQLLWQGDGGQDRREVVFSHEPPWEGIGRNDLAPTLQRLGDGGWELVGLTGTVNWMAIVPAQHIRYVFKRANGS